MACIYLNIVSLDFMASCFLFFSCLNLSFDVVCLYMVILPCVGIIYLRSCCYHGVHDLACMNVFIVFCAKATSNLFAACLHFMICALLLLKNVLIRNLFLVLVGYLWVILPALGLQFLLRIFELIMRFLTLL